MSNNYLETLNISKDQRTTAFATVHDFFYLCLILFTVIWLLFETLNIFFIFVIQLLVVDSYNNGI